MPILVGEAQELQRAKQTPRITKIAGSIEGWQASKVAVKEANPGILDSAEGKEKVDKVSMGSSGADKEERDSLGIVQM